LGLLAASKLFVSGVVSAAQLVFFVDGVLDVALHTREHYSHGVLQAGQHAARFGFRGT